MIDDRLLKVLACPLCEGRPPLKEVDGYLVCSREGSRFPIVEGIPQLLPELALPPFKEAVE